MPDFIVTANSPFQLSELEYDDIVLKKVASVANDIHHLLCHVQIISHYPDGHGRTLPFHPGSYINAPYAKQAITDEFYKVLRNCKYKRIEITAPTNFQLRFYYEKANFKIDIITVSAVKQLDGTTYSLHPISYFSIKKQFPNSMPVKSVFVGHDVRISFELMYGPVFSHVISSLTGLKSDELENVREVQFIEPSTKNLRFSLYNESGE